VQHVFLLLVYLGTGDARTISSNDMFFEDIDRCNYFASRIVRRYGNYRYYDYLDPRDRVTAYCVPKLIKKGSVTVY